MEKCFSAQNKLNRILCIEIYRTKGDKNYYIAIYIGKKGGLYLLISFNVFFPNERLREIYMQKILNITKNAESKTQLDLLENSIKEIDFKRHYKKMPGYWLSIKLDDQHLCKSLWQKIYKVVPDFWIDKHLFFPKQITSLNEMEKLWFQKYNFVQDLFELEAWKLFYEEAKKHWKEGRLEVAEAALTIIYKYNPFFLKKYKRYYIFEALAYCYEAEGEISRSIRCLKMQAYLQPDSAEPYLNMSSFLLLNGFYEEAVSVCEKGLKISSEDPYLRNNLMIAYLNSGYFEEAILYLQKLIKKEPYISTNWKLAGDVFSQVGKYQLAVISYQRALVIHSEDIYGMIEDIHYGLGICYQQLGQFDNAIKYYQKLLESENIESGFLLNLSAIYRDILHQFDEAELYGREFIKLYPQNGYGHYNLGLVYLSTNKFKKAKWHLYKAKKLIPFYTPVYDAIVTLKQKEKTQC